jgi:hypothetical protein
MSENINQVFIANPITSNASTDLMYFGQSPYGAGNDAAMTYGNFKLQFTPAFNWTVIAGTTQTAAISSGYIPSNGSLTTITLPAVAAVGSIIRICGQGAGGWSIVYGAAQSIIIGSKQSTVTTGNLSSSNANDTVELLCTVANTTFTVLSSVGNLTYV